MQPRIPSHTRQPDNTPHQNSWRKSIRILWDFLFNKPSNTRPKGRIPVQALNREALLAAADETAFRLGHSTMLLKLQGEFWLTDPVFSQRASPVQWAGPLRFHQPPISIEALPPIKAVILSHDHYDHLDHAAVLKLAAKTEFFLTPRGVGDILIRWGISPDKIRQLEWWESTELSGMRFIATPAQHFSGRGLFDSNKTLWASWVMLGAGLRLFFSGDSGYFDGFRHIGEHFGPFDLTMMETGAYNENWARVHMQPEETMQAHLDLGGSRLLPLHNGTFDLSMHAWQEPFERIVKLAAAHDVAVCTPQMGQAFSLRQHQPGQTWWTQVDTAEAVRGSYRPCCLSNNA